ncbi:peptide ABC transporter substrate-binding protein [Bacillus sp. CLL-7-23]|uniref:Peptide ABC transporter substrate-binding protein n=1 Tax=Bacillus changyiensis TaxID=3004103 RepID=A0ABT4X252_9BACI|nr:peptide ABC transporter substrate-binding protein [Bacillus changyiensis]MDA7026172.1 peptide ABC transporter substrate-binding protein [Bacillus changyiensis]
MKRLSSSLIIMLMAVMLFGCTANQQAGQTGKKGGSDQEQVLKLNNEKEPTSFDPPIGFNSVSWQALNNLMEGLTRLGADHEPAAATAEKWNISEDGKTYTFTIRNNAKWSNGDPLTAGDFEYAWKRLLDPKTGSSAAFLGYVIEGGEAFNSGKGKKDEVKVKALDEKTLKVTLARPQTSFLDIVANPAFFPIPQKVANNNPKWHEEASTFVGNGPFKLTEWKHDESLTMEKSDTYWDENTVKLDKVTWAMVDDRNTDYQMFQSNELDTSFVPAEMSEKLMSSKQVKVFDQAGLYFYRFNVKMEPFQNEKLRKAFALAVDQQEIVDYVTKNGEKPARAFVSPDIKGQNGKSFREEGGNLVQFNADQAKKLLKEGMTEEHYQTLPAVTLTYSTKPEHKKMAEAIQQQLKRTLGINVKLANMEWNTFLEEQKALKFQFSQSSFLPDYADPVNFLESFQTDNAMNRTGWSNKAYDQLIRAADSDVAEEKRQQLMHQAEKLLFEEMPIIPIHFYKQVHLEKENVKGIIRHPVGYIELKWAEKQ